MRDCLNENMIIRLQNRFNLIIIFLVMFNGSNYDLSFYQWEINARVLRLTLFISTVSLQLKANYSF